MTIPLPEFNLSKKFRYAVVCIIDGSPQESLNALVLGESLRDHAVGFDKILMVYGACNEILKRAFQLVWDNVYCVKDIRGSFNSSNLDCKFNNLYLFTLLDYEKVLLIESHLLVTGSLLDVFSFKAPALPANDKLYAWSSNQLIPNAALLSPDGRFQSKTDIFLVEPSQDEWDDSIDYLKALLEETDDLGLFRDFIIRYFQGSWYSLSHEYNFRDRFVIYGSKQTFGVPPQEQLCRVIGFRESIKPSDIFFFGEDLHVFQDKLPVLLQEIIERVTSWNDFPTLAPSQSATDRCLAIYRCWFETLFSLTERISDRLGVTLFQVVRPAPTFPVEELEARSKEAYENREVKEKARAVRPVRRFQLGKNVMAPNDRKLEVTDKAVVSRFRTIGS